MAALFADEMIEAIKYTQDPLPYLPQANPDADHPWLGAANDAIMRDRGMEFVDGTAPGFAACVGYCPTNEEAVRIAHELQEKNLYVFLAAGTNGRSMADQLREEGVQLGWDTRLVPFGGDVTACVHALGFATRAALSFGGASPGDFKKSFLQQEPRVRVCVGSGPRGRREARAGRRRHQFRLSDDLGNRHRSDPSQRHLHVRARRLTGPPSTTSWSSALEVRGCKINVTKVPIPVAFGPAFEGERIRKQDMQVEFGGNRTTAFEFVTSVDPGTRSRTARFSSSGPTSTRFRKADLCRSGSGLKSPAERCRPTLSPFWSARCTTS